MQTTSRFFGDYVNWERLAGFRHLALTGPLPKLARELIGTEEDFTTPCRESGRIVAVSAAFATGACSAAACLKDGASSGSAGKAPGILSRDETLVRMYLERGALMVAVGLDVARFDVARLVHPQVAGQGVRERADLPHRAARRRR